jgi:hypothetical protein
MSISCHLRGGFVSPPGAQIETGYRLANFLSLSEAVGSSLLWRSMLAVTLSHRERHVGPDPGAHSRVRLARSDTISPLRPGQPTQDGVTQKNGQRRVDHFTNLWGRALRLPELSWCFLTPRYKQYLEWTR